MCFTSIYSVLNKLSEYIYFYTFTYKKTLLLSYTFAACFKLVESLQCIFKKIFVINSGNGCFWRASSFAGVSFCTAFGFYSKQTDNCFIMMVLRNIFPLSFLKVWIKLLFERNKNLSKVPDKKDTRTASVMWCECIYN